MMFAFLGLLIAALDAYGWLFRPDSHRPPNAITFALPIVIAAGVLRRPASERVAILTLAAMVGISLNRTLIAQPAIVHVLVFAGAGYLAWWAHQKPDIDKAAFKRFAIVVAITLGGFVLVWLWQML